MRRARKRASRRYRGGQRRGPKATSWTTGSSCRLAPGEEGDDVVCRPLRDIVPGKEGSIPATIPTLAAVPGIGGSRQIVVGTWRRSGTSLFVLALLMVGTFVTPALASTKHKVKPKHPSSTITVKAAGRQYLALVNPVNTTIATFVSQANGWSDSTTDAQAEADAQPVIKDLQNLQTGLLRDRWPSVARNDIKALVQSIAPLVGDLEGLASLNLLSASSWETTFERDASSTGTAANIVRSDLGLPPAKNS